MTGYFKELRETWGKRRRDIDINPWYCIEDVLKWMDAVRNGKWDWTRNNRCKYITVRIDSRGGQCVIMVDGKRITPEELMWQYGDPEPTPHDEVERKGFT